MTERPPKNLPASVRQRLLNLARETGRPFEQVLKYYAMERFLYRLSQSPHAASFVLKGALMLQVWQGPQARHTEDMDFLGHTANDPQEIAEATRSVCLQPVEPDGLVFHADTVNASRMTFDPRFSGVRATFRVTLDTARVQLRLDVGFGDAVVPGSAVIAFPALLDFPAPVLHGYSRESSLAEKFQAMVQHGETNSRLKDFFDIWLLSRQFDFSGEILARAVAETFRHHRQEITPSPHAFGDAFAQDPVRCAQWRRYLSEYHLPEGPADFPEVVQGISTFLAPVAAALASDQPFTAHWPAAGPWQEASL